MRKPFSTKRSKTTQCCAGLLMVLVAISMNGLALPPVSGSAPADEAAGTAATGKKSASARSVTDLKTEVREGKLVVSILSDGPLSYQEFTLQNPPRLVLDLMEVENRVPFLRLPVDAASVKQVRVRQFQSADPPITRMVFDLDSMTKYTVDAGGDMLKIVFPMKDSSSPSPNAPQPSRTSETPGAASTQTPSPARRALESPSESVELKTVPIINDLAASEIPLSAQGAQAPVQFPEPAPAPTPRSAPPAAPPVAEAAKPEPSRGRVLIMNAPQESRFAGQPLTLDLVGIDLIDFFRLMAEEGGINIVMDPEITGIISIKVVKVPWDQIFEAALLNNGLDKQIEGNLVRIAKKRTLEEEAKQRESLKKANLLAADLETRILRLNYSKAASFLNTLMDQKTVRGTVVVDERTNSLVLTDIPSTIDSMVELITALDVPQPQVEIEARIVSATRDFARDIGVQFGFVQGNLERVTVGGPNTFGTIGGTRPSATPSSTFAGGNPSTGRGASNSTASQSAGVSTGANNTGNFNVNLPSNTPFGGIGLSIGNIFDTFLLDAAITAGESKGLAKLISQPKVTAQNNQVATITQGLRFPVQIIANNTVTIQFQNAALTLTVTPQITHEGNVVLDLKVENNTADFGRQVNGIPSIRTSESATRVLVSDGGTTVIGGILLDDEATNEDRVPGLASLPIFGNLFRRSSVSRSTQEVLFFITPRIVK